MHTRHLFPFLAAAGGAFSQSQYNNENHNLFSRIPNFGQHSRHPIGVQTVSDLSSGLWSPHSVSKNVNARVADLSQLFLTEKTKGFAVDGTAIPDVDFDIGESYAGLLPISKNDDGRKLYFWFFPSPHEESQDSITIWLNGGPGCSSLEGLLQENGPFSWQFGTFKPVKNPYSWHNLTHMLWVEQPVGTGFSQGAPLATDQKMVAQEFLGFFRNFIDTFDLRGKKIYITGESYAGYYVPYIADAMITANNTQYFDLESIMMFNPSTTTSVIQQQVTLPRFVDRWAPLLNLNKTFQTSIRNQFKSCGYDNYLEKYLQYPPAGLIPQPAQNEFVPGCDLWGTILQALLITNPCFSVYHVATTCPFLWDVLGFPGSFNYLPAGAQIYFKREDVQRAINAPVQQWDVCSGNVLRRDRSAPSGLSVLPRVIENTNRTVIVHGELDYILMVDGTLLMIQNMTWNGQQGFTAPPTNDFNVPDHPEQSLSTLSGSGVMGRTITQRGLTFVEAFVSGHMVPQFQPAAAYRQLEFMLGRVNTLSEPQPFTRLTPVRSKRTPANAQPANPRRANRKIANTHTINAQSVKPEPARNTNPARGMKISQIISLLKGRLPLGGVPDR